MDPEIYIIVSKGKASLKELDQDYCTADAYDLLEILDLESDLDQMAHRDAERDAKTKS